MGHWVSTNGLRAHMPVLGKPIALFNTHTSWMSLYRGWRCWVKSLLLALQCRRSARRNGRIRKCRNWETGRPGFWVRCLVSKTLSSAVLFSWVQVERYKYWLPIPDLNLNLLFCVTILLTLTTHQVITILQQLVIWINRIIPFQVNFHLILNIHNNYNVRFCWTHEKRW